jgi:hypothetical protein
VLFFMVFGHTRKIEKDSNLLPSHIESGPHVTVQLWVQSVVSKCSALSEGQGIPSHSPTVTVTHTRVYPKVSGLSHTEINNNKHSLISNTKSYGGKTH